MNDVVPPSSASASASASASTTTTTTAAEVMSSSSSSSRSTPIPTPATTSNDSPFKPGRPPISPLKQVNLNSSPFFLSTKFETCWNELTTNSDLFQNSSIPQLDRYFNELFCLKPNPKLIDDRLNELELGDLLRPFKNNICYLFTHATKILKESKQEDHLIKSNIVETLIPFLRNILSRRYTNFSYETMTLLAGSLSHSDTIFTNLVSSIDSTLQDRNLPTPLRHRTLELTLTLVSLVNQGSINAYFLRRDLFSTLVSFMTDPETCHYSFESSLLLGLLANYRNDESRNPYRVRFEDMVEETVMSRVLDVIQVVCTQARDSYTSITDDAPASFVASITSIVMSFRISDMFNKNLSIANLKLPPPPLSSSSSLVDEELVKNKTSRPLENRVGNGKGTEKKDENGNGTKSSAAPIEQPSIDATSTSTLNSSSEMKEKIPTTTTIKATSTFSKEESLFKSMPNEVLVILLPFYDLLNLNKNFGAIALANDSNGKPSTIPPILISLSSYVLCHASVSNRAKRYARLCLSLLIILVEESDGKLSKITGQEIRICRQRIPMLPRVNGKRPAFAAMLDCCVIFLRHNLKKKLDVENFIICLRLIQRILQQLKTERARLSYDWVIIWRSVLSLSAFLVSNITSLRQTSSIKVDDLISQIFILLSYAAYWGETLFPTTRDSALFFYELLHSDSTLRALSDLLGISSIPETTSSISSNSSNLKIPSSMGRTLAVVQATPLIRPSPSLTHGSPNAFDLNKSNDFDSDIDPSIPSTSSTSISTSTLSSSSTTIQPITTTDNSKFIATECVSNLHLARSHFIHHIEIFKNRNSKGGEDPTPDPEEIVKVIQDSLGALELIESSAMGDMRKGEGNLASVGGATERAVVNVICEDTLSILTG